MKCDDCLNLLESYLDGEASERESEQVQTHLATCANCVNQFEALSAENEIYARYDRGIQISPALWNGIAARINSEERQIESKSKFNLAEWLSVLFAAPSLKFAMPTVALVAIAVVVGLAYWKTRPQQLPTNTTATLNGNTPPTPGRVEPPLKAPESGSQTPADQTPVSAPVFASNTKRPKVNNSRSGDQSDVLFADAAYTDMEDRDTVSHLEQAQNLLLSFRNIKYSDTDEEVDVSYEKAESRRLLSENVVLRRDAEMSGKFPAKAMLGSLEPFLIDIANLPDKAKPNDLRQITDRVQRTEIVAELRGY